MASWIPIFLTFNPEWKARIMEELRAFLKNHTRESNANLPLFEKLGEVPPSAWEQELPLLDLCIRETIRVVLTGVTLRRAFGSNITFNQQKIPSGTFVAFPVTTVHHDPKVYTNPDM